MNKQLQEEMKAFEESIRRQAKIIKAIDVYNHLVLPTEEELKGSNGRWLNEDPN